MTVIFRAQDGLLGSMERPCSIAARPGKVQDAVELPGGSWTVFDARDHPAA